MTEIFTTQPTPGEPPPNGKSPSDKKLNVLIGGAAVFLVIALGILGWVLVKGGDGGSELATAQEDESAQVDDRDAKRSKGNDPDEADRDADAGGQVTLPKSNTTAAGGTGQGTGGAATTTPGGGTSASGGTSPVVPVDVSASNTRESVASLRCTRQPLGYYGDQLIDGDPQTGWGASKSDGSGQTARFNFGGSKQISTVGITPGYIRVAERADANCAVVSAFPYNRFVDSVRWEFEDGSSEVQTFEQRGEMQTIEVNKQTSFVRMVILSTTRPPGADDDTVISEAEFTGTP